MNPFSYAEYRNIITMVSQHLPIRDFKDVLKSNTFYFDNSLSNNPVLTKYHNLEEQLGVDDSIMYQWILRFFIDDTKISLPNVWKTLDEQEWVNNNFQLLILSN